MTLPELRTKAKSLAQNAATTGATGVQLLLNDPADYDEAILNALRVFDTDRPNRRVFDHTVVTAGFRFTLGGTGTILPAAPDPDAWVDGGSRLIDVWFPFLATDQGAQPMDRNWWRTTRIPGGKEVLELLSNTAALGQVLRLEYARPHAVDATDAAKTSVLAADERAVITLSASMVLLIAAIKAVQNTGNTGLPNDIVDRRNQSDIFKSRAKDLRDVYASQVGAAGADASPASGFLELDAETSYGAGRLWHPAGRH